MKKWKQARQGDVFMTMVSDIPEGAKELPPDGDRVVLAYGEVTGHAHAIPKTASKLFSFEGKTYLRVMTPTALRHEEHAPINLQPGCYEIIHQREYSPEEVRRVAD